MSPDRPTDSLDVRLQAAFAGLDTRPDFEERLRARLARESEIDAGERARQALHLEQQRHRAVLERASWRRKLRWISGFLTLDSLGAAVLIAIAAATLWSQLNPYLMQRLG